jgi:translation elongation factor EF-G
MKDLVSLYKSNQLFSGPKYAYSEVESVWDQIKKEAPSMIAFLNKLDAKSTDISESEVLIFNEKLETFSKITKFYCSMEMRKDVPYFDKELNSFCEKMMTRVDFSEYTFSVLAITNEFALIKNFDVAFKMPSISLYAMLCKILMRPKDDLQVFLYYLHFRIHMQSLETLKACFTAQFYLISKIP